MPRDARRDVLRQLRGDRPARQRTLLAPAFAATATAERRTVRHARTSTPERRQRCSIACCYADIKTYLVELLMKQDQMSMAASIESRVPFLDHQLVEFVGALPPRLKLRGLTTKWILREAVRDLLPRGDPDAPEDGLPGAVRDMDARRVERRRARRAARPPQPRARHHRPGQRRAADRTSTPRDAPTAATRCGALLNLELWYRTFIDGEGVQTLPAEHAPPTGKRSPVARRRA